MNSPFRKAYVNPKRQKNNKLTTKESLYTHTNNKFTIMDSLDTPTIKQCIYNSENFIYNTTTNQKKNDKSITPETPTNRKQ